MLTKTFYQLIFVTVLTCTAVCSGCVTVLDATTQNPIQTDPRQRSFGGYIDDKQLKTIVAVNIRKASALLDEAHVVVYSFNSVVLLTGEVPNNETRILAGETARKVNRVRLVHNELTVAENSRFGARANDKWLKSKIKAKLLLHKDIDSGKVKVIVQNRTVYLMGLLTKIQTEKITDVIKKTKGISKIIRAVEYIQ
ncbi:MAG: phospholipid-binding protein [Alteromonadaceae bacterium]|nr:MAG: phospholipid-binding protein [Alteromonadaceae bacterium]